MGAALDDAPPGEHHDHLRVLHRGEPVRDDEHGAAPDQPVDRFLHEALGLHVERARGLVEDEDRRIAQQRPRDRDALALPAAEPGAALAQQRVVALRELDDEVMGVRGAGRGLDLVPGEVGAAVGDVGEHRVVQEDRLLRHDPHEAPQARAREPRDRHPVHQDRAFGGLVEARQQVHERRLPRPRRPDDRDHLAAPHGEVHVLEHRGFAVIAERHAAVLDRLPEPRLGRVRVIALVGRYVEHLEDAVRGGHGARHDRGVLCRRLHRRHQPECHDEECDEHRRG